MRLILAHGTNPAQLSSDVPGKTTLCNRAELVRHLSQIDSELRGQYRELLDKLTQLLTALASITAFNLTLPSTFYDLETKTRYLLVELGDRHLRKSIRTAPSNNLTGIRLCGKSLLAADEKPMKRTRKPTLSALSGGPLNPTSSFFAKTGLGPSRHEKNRGAISYLAHRGIANARWFWQLRTSNTDMWTVSARDSNERRRIPLPEKSGALSERA